MRAVFFFFSNLGFCEKRERGKNSLQKLYTKRCALRNDNTHAHGRKRRKRMRPIVDKRVDDSPSYNVARDRFVGTTFTGETTTTKNKKPFGVLHYRAGNEKEMVFTPNSPNKSRLSTTTTTNGKNQYGNHYPLKCLDANAILMASPSLNDTKNKNSLKRSSILLMQQQQKRDGVQKSATTTTRDGENKNTFTPEISSSSSFVNATTIPTSPVLSLLRTMFSSWNYPNNGTTVIAAEDILSPAADVAKFECGRTPKSSPVDFSTAQEHHDTALANALFISEASKRLQKICNEQRTRALLDASANGISPGSSRILIDSVDGGCMSSSSDEDEDEEEIESASIPSSPPSEKEEVMTIADEKEVEEQTTPMSSMAMPTRALFSSPGKASLTDDDAETEEKLEMTIDNDDEKEYEYEIDGKYALLYAKMKTAVQVNAERYIRAAKRCSGDKVARENFCYKLWHHEAFSELFLSATFTALCELSLRLKSAFIWNDSNANAGANIVAVGIESAYFVNYFVDQIGKCLGAAMSSSATTLPSSSPLHFTDPTTLAERRNYDDKFIYSCIAYAFAYVFVRAVFFLFDKSKDVSYWEKKFSSFHHKVVQNFTPVKRFVEKKRARWNLVCNRLNDDDDDDNAEAVLMKTP